LSSEKLLENIYQKAIFPSGDIGYFAAGFQPLSVPFGENNTTDVQFWWRMFVF